MDRQLHEIEREAWTIRASYYDALFAPVSTQAIEPILDSLGDLKGKRLVDVACGTGHLVAAASRRCAASEGVDFAPAMVEAARKSYPRERFRVADAADLPYELCSIDAITCAFGLLHMEDPQAAVNEAFRVLKAGGRYAFTLWFGPDDGNELFSILQDVISRLATALYAVPEDWTRMRDADPRVCEEICQKAGFQAPIYKRLPITWHPSSAKQAVDHLQKLSVRTKMIFDHQSSMIQAHIVDAIIGAVEARRVNESLSLAWPALLTVAQKPLEAGTHGSS